MAGPLDIDDDMQHMVLRKGEATAKGGHAFQRLLQLAQTRDSGQVRRVALFIAATCNGEAFPFDLFELRAGGRCDQRRHARVHRRAALGPVRPAKPGAVWRPAGEGGHRPVGPEVARGALTAGQLSD